MNGNNLEIGRDSVSGFVLALAVVLSMVAGAGAVTAAQSTSTAPDCSVVSYTGTGTSDDPYQVENVSQLQCMNQDLDGHYQLVSDIDASNTSEWNGGDGFSQIGSYSDKFNGMLDGDGHTISGLQTTGDGGLFADIGSSGVVTDMIIKDSFAKANYDPAVVAGSNAGDISDLYVTAEIDSSGSGSVVSINTGTIEDVRTDITMTDTSNMGAVSGLTVTNDNGTISRVLAENHGIAWEEKGTESTVADAYYISGNSTAGTQISPADAEQNVMGFGWTESVDNIPMPVDNSGPAAAISVANQTYEPGESVEFDASGSSDPEGDSLTFSWDLDGDGNYDDATGEVVNTSFSSSGTQTVTVKVDDGHDTQTTSQTVEIASQNESTESSNSAPENVSIALPDEVEAGEESGFTASADDADGDSLDYEWDFDGDGETDATSSDVTYTPSESGEMTISVEVSDGTATTTATETVSVQPELFNAVIMVQDDAQDVENASVEVSQDGSVVASSETNIVGETTDLGELEAGNYSVTVESGGETYSVDDYNPSKGYGIIDISGDSATLSHTDIPLAGGIVAGAFAGGISIIGALLILSPLLMVAILGYIAVKMD
jgi:hypothetical protein